MAKQRNKKPPKAPKFPKEVYVEWTFDENGPWHYLNISEEPTSEQNETKKMAVYKFDRIVTVENKTEVKG